MRTLFVSCMLVGAAQEPAPSVGPPGMEAGAQKMLELFAKVELKLREIDVLLFDASAGETKLAPVEEAGIGDLLQNALERGREVQAGIDEILELARQQRPSPSQSSGSQQQQQQQPGQSPLDQKRNQDGGQREQTPTKPQEQPGDEQQQGGQPDDPGPDPDADTGNSPAGDPPQSETERVGVPSATERWGTLPVHVREIFRVEGADDLPPQYRDWIDGYYRRLAKIQRP
jgi:hypothetical protein